MRRVVIMILFFPGLHFSVLSQEAQLTGLYNMILVVKPYDEIQDLAVSEKLTDKLRKHEVKRCTTVSVPLKNFSSSIIDLLHAEYNYWNNDSIKKETDLSVSEKLTGYWSVTRSGVSAKQVRDSNWQKRNPWSAAFISWVMREAGAGNLFKYADTHAAYVVWIRESTKRKNSNCPFRVYDVRDSLSAWPQPGDLLCKNRNGNKYTLSTIQPYCMSHCDIVVSVDKENRIVTTIGGNVKNRVNKTFVYLTPQGFIDKNCDWINTDEKGNTCGGPQKEYYAVIRLNQ